MGGTRSFSPLRGDRRSLHPFRKKEPKNTAFKTDSPPGKKTDQRPTCLRARLRRCSPCCAWFGKRRERECRIVAGSSLPPVYTARKSHCSVFIYEIAFHSPPVLPPLRPRVSFVSSETKCSVVGVLSSVSFHSERVNRTTPSTALPCSNWGSVCLVSFLLSFSERTFQVLKCTFW